MEELLLLIVEDDENVISTYKRNINSFNLESDIKIVSEIVEKKENAIQILNGSQKGFDAAIIDLDLMGSGGRDSSGNDVIRHIKNNLRFPIFVISGTINNLDAEFKESDFFKIRVRGEEGDYLKEIIKIYKTGITQILKRSGQIEKYITKIFWDHLSNSLDLWINDTKKTPEVKQQSLLRYTLLHIQEYLELTEDSDFQNYYPAEVYITPPIKDSIFTGDLVKDKKTNELFVVLTPSCDLAHSSKTNDILIALIETKTSLLTSEIKKIKAGQGSTKAAKNIVKKLIGNSYSGKYHFLPQYKNIVGGLINFQKIHSVEKDKISEKYDRIATINGSFTKDIIARFSYYYSRQGSPDFNIDEVYNSLING